MALEGLDGDYATSFRVSIESACNRGGPSEFWLISYADRRTVHDALIDQSNEFRQVLAALSCISWLVEDSQ